MHATSVSGASTARCPRQQNRSSDRSVVLPPSTECTCTGSSPSPATPPLLPYTQTVQSLMHKLLLHLVSELRRLGVTVVHADPSSLILCTGKSSLAAAVGYADYILETLGKRELLQYISFTPTRMWHALLYKDRCGDPGCRVPAGGAPEGGLP